ncbi:hypothetical protein EMIT0P291_370021 [Pseudomonas sp. IT-P291]
MLKKGHAYQLSKGLNTAILVGASLLAMTVGQSHKECLTVRHREQARSHNVRGLADWH